MIQRARPSRLRLGLRAFGIGLSVFLAGFLLDWFLAAPRPVLYSDALSGLVAMLLAYLVLAQADARARVSAESLHVVSEVNHHVRNALAAILLSVHVRRDPELLEITESAVERIDWVLNQVLGRYGNSTAGVPRQRLRKSP